MNNEFKELKARIRSYFGSVKNEVRVFRYHRHRIIAVEYEDFHAEQRVEQDIRQLCGDGYLLTVKRECSDAMLLRMLRFVMGEGGGRYCADGNASGRMDSFALIAGFEP